MIEGPRVVGFHDAARSLMGATGLWGSPLVVHLVTRPCRLNRRGFCFWGPGIETHAGLMIEGGSTYFSHHGNE